MDSFEIVFSFGVILMVILIIASMIIKYPEWEENYVSHSKSTCESDCDSFGYDFFKYNYDSGGFGSPIMECWCKTDESSRRIW